SVFVKPPAKSRAYRARGAIAIGANILALAVILMLGGRFYEQRAGWRWLRPITREMALEAVDEWVGGYASGRGEFTILLGAQPHLPMAFLGPELGDRYRAMAVRYLTTASRENVAERVSMALSQPRALYNIVSMGILTREELAGIGFSPENVRETLERIGPDAIQKMNDASRGEATTQDGTYPYVDMDEIACRLACLRAFGCLDLVDGDRLAAYIAAHQVTQDWPVPEGSPPIDVEKASGLFCFGFCDASATRGALWALETLGALKRIDREACIDGIMRFYQGRGVFRADVRASNIFIYGHEESAYLAMESLVILGALDDVTDLAKWRFKPETSTRGRGREAEYGVVTPDGVVSWARQLRLDELRDGLGQ
ncbi:MAG: hypothetical protein JXR94_12075, partial [Candidatus Hydrogenedentes bacterium]|nr:hypothetical protein [Candidatus Hydrogenedentota bacterium]